MNFIKCILLAILLVSIDSISNRVFADTIKISRASPLVRDHGNPNEPGSIASYFSQHGAGHTYVLTTPNSNNYSDADGSLGGSYAIYTTLTLPVGATLTSETGVTAFLKTHGYDSPVLLNVSESSTVSNVILDGDYKAIQVIKGRVVNGQGANGFTLKNSVVRRTSNNNGLLRVRAHLVNIQHANGVSITDSFITQAGDSGYRNGTGDNNRNTEASGLLLTNNTNVNVTGNTISYVLSSGVGITNSTKVSIINNTIDNTGRAGLYFSGPGAYKADGITGYHNAGLPANTNLEYKVHGNTITNWYNHGIHLSGRDLSVFDNTVTNPGIQGTRYRSAIYIGDFREPNIQCSRIIWIQRNHVDISGLTDATGIRMGHYHYPSYWPSQNTGDVGSATFVSDHRYNTALDPSCNGAFAVVE